jgi:outer membrane murein-binding lipoprotein Lpp
MKKWIIVLVLVTVVMSMFLVGCGNSAKVNELEVKVTTLTKQNSDLQKAYDDLQSQLNAKEKEITGLTAKAVEAEDLAKQLKTEKATVAELTADLKDAQEDRDKLQGDIFNLATERDALQEQIAALQPQLRDPATADEVRAFLAADNANELAPGDYSLAAALLIENAAKQGIQCHYVVAELAAGFGYNLAGFYLADEEKWLYVVASSDFIVKVVVNESYSASNNFPKPNYNDKVVAIHFSPVP